MSGLWIDSWAKDLWRKGGMDERVHTMTNEVNCKITWLAAWPVGWLASLQAKLAT